MGSPEIFGLARPKTPRTGASNRDDRTPRCAVSRIAGLLLMIREALRARPVVTVATLRAPTGFTTPAVDSLLREPEPSRTPGNAGEEGAI